MLCCQGNTSLAITTDMVNLSYSMAKLTKQRQMTLVTTFFEQTKFIRCAKPLPPDVLLSGK